MAGCVLVDSGPLVALFDNSDEHHHAARAWIERSGMTKLVSNVAVLTEACYLIGSMVSPRAAADLVDWAMRAMEIDRDLPDDFTRISAIIRTYDDLPADFTDASLVALAERRMSFTVATVDDDFTVYRGATKRAFRNVFFAPPGR